MRILYLGINYWPDETGIAPFATGRCEYLAARGHQVVACTGFPYYPQWRVADEYRGHVVLREEKAGVAIARSWIYVPRKLTALRRVLHESSFVCSSLLRAFGGTKPDLVFATSPPLGLAGGAIILSRLWRVPYVLHVTDLQPDAAVDLGMLRPGPLTRALFQLEGAAYRNAALVSTLTEAMRARIVAKDVAAEKVVIFSDWVDPSLFNLPVGAPPGGNKSGAEFVVAHFGNMGVKQGLDVVLEAAELSRSDRTISYLLVGDGAARPALERRARELKVENVRFLPLQPRPEFLDMLAQTDICLVTQQHNVSDVVFPSKLITLLAAGRPIIASVSAASEVARVVTESAGGVIAAPGDPLALLDAIARLRGDSAMRTRMGLAGRAYALARWERRAVLESTERQLSAVLNGGGAAAGHAGVSGMD